MRARAEAAATQQLLQLSPAVRFRARPGDLDDWQDSLIAGVSATDIADDFVQEASDELTDREDLLAKLRAAFSASALAVNTFGPYRHHPELLSMAGLSGFSETRFEYPCPNGLSGTYPHFDFWGAARNGVLAVASTCLEPLDPQTYRYLDAAQLMKYYLGMKHSYPDRRRVRGLETNLVALSYPDLWSQREGHSTWPEMADHLARLRALLLPDLTPLPRQLEHLVSGQRPGRQHATHALNQHTAKRSLERSPVRPRLWISLTSSAVHRDISELRVPTVGRSTWHDSELPRG